MTEAAKNITNLRPPEQDFGQNQELAVCRRDAGVAPPVSNGRLYA